MLKVTLITADSLAGTLFLNALVKGGVPIDKVLVVSSLRGSLFGRLVQGWGLLRKKSIIFLLYRYFVEDVIFQLFCRYDKNLHSIQHVAAHNQIALKRIVDVNSAECLSEFEDGQDENRLVISAYGSQIFGKELIGKIDAFWNVHGSYLPYFRGAAPYFWMLMMDQYPRGVTLHQVDPRLDQGPIIKQMIVDPDPEDTLFLYHAKCVLAAARMVMEAVKEATEDGTTTSVPQDPTSLTGKQRFGIPASRDMKSFRAARRRLFARRDFREVVQLI